MSNQPLTASALHASLLRAPLLQILRANGYHATSPGVLDALTSITTSYMKSLATTVSELTASHYKSSPGVHEVRLALEQLGAFAPSKTAIEQWIEDEEDTRGVHAFIAWCMGEVAKADRRMAGIAGETDLEGLYRADLADGEKLDFLTSERPRSGENVLVN
jgi:transcription initiation factor TFIID subunit 3